MIAPTSLSAFDSDITAHAGKRMQMRNVSIEAVQLALDYGRTFYSREVVFTVVGRKEIRRYRDEIDLEDLNGLHVICGRNGDVITVYRNRQFRTKNYPNQRRRPRRRHRRRLSPW